MAYIRDVWDPIVISFLCMFRILYVNNKSYIRKNQTTEINSKFVILKT
jgi:hypothetical protein